MFVMKQSANHLVFLDESGVNINMTRHYARAWKKRRAVDKTPLNTPCNTNVLSSIRLNGDCAYTVYQGGTTAEWFAEYLKTKLLPTLSEADIIVMDNMRSHHAKALKQLKTQSIFKERKDTDGIGIIISYFKRILKCFSGICWIRSLINSIAGIVYLT